MGLSGFRTLHPANTVTLAPGRLYALPLVFGLDRPRSAFPPTAHGFGTVNCYLLEESGQALLVDTGFPVFRDTVLAALDTLVPPSTALSMIALRPAEVSSLGNLFAILEHRQVDVLYAGLPEDLLRCFDIRPLSERSASGGRERRYEALASSQTVVLGDARRLEVFKPMLQLLGQLWMYDEGTRTMFTSEYFGHHWSASAEGPWIVDDVDSDPTTADSLADFLRSGNRTWWLAGADGETLAGWVEDTFASRAVECIAPAFGAIIRGRALVERHVELLQEALRNLGREPVALPAAGR